MIPRTDSQIQQDIVAELRWDPSISGVEIGVAVKGGVVTLSGNVDSFAKKLAAIHATERVAGVRAIAEELRVMVPADLRRTDTQIAHAVRNALAWDIEIPEADKILARVDEGWVWLEGEVDWQYQKNAAERAVRYLTGVKGVTNLLKLKPRVFAPDVKKRIEDALKRNAELDAHRISVETANGKVTLRGSVRTWTEREDAERAAWAAPGVTAVEDQLAVHA